MGVTVWWQNKRGICTGLIMAAGGLICGGAASLAVDTGRAAAAPKPPRYCDEVCELRSQDGAFSLLLEVYRQFRSRQIQTDYEARLQAATALGKQGDSLLIQTSAGGLATLRSWVLYLANEERTLRLAELQTQVANFRTAYDCARRRDQQDLDTIVPNQVDTRVAAAHLQNLDIIAVGSPGNANLRLVRPVSARKVLLDAAPVVAPESPIAPCE